MKRLVVSSLTALCGLALTATAHASYVEKSFQPDPDWRTQEEVDAAKAVELDARTEVPSTQADAVDEMKKDFNDADGSEKSKKQFGDKLTNVEISPLAPVTRAEFTAMLVRASYPKGSIDGCYWDITSVWPPNFDLLFRDVPVNHEFAAEICVAMREGLVRGYGNDTFRPDIAISFADAAKIVSRSHGLTPWADPSSPKHWFDPYVNALARRNAIPMSIEAIEERLTGEEAQEIVNRLALDDRSKTSRTAEELITAWEKKYEKPRRTFVMTVTLPGKPTAPAASSASTSSMKAASSSVRPKSSAAPIIPTGETSSRPKAWYEF